MGTRESRLLTTTTSFIGPREAQIISPVHELIPYLGPSTSSRLVVIGVSRTGHEKWSLYTTTSFSTSVCRLGIRILDSFWGGGVTGTEAESSSCVGSGGNCLIVASKRHGARAMISAGGANEGPVPQSAVKDHLLSDFTRKTRKQRLPYLSAKWDHVLYAADLHTCSEVVALF